MSDEWEDDLDAKCPHCEKRGGIEWRSHEDSEGHEDYQYHCKYCEKKWWVDGSDY